jgi:hypothetical protein
MLLIIRCTSNQSLRKDIGHDEKILNDHGLTVATRKKKGRSKGWTKLKSTRGAAGAINLEWNAQERMLTCRVVTRQRNKPHELLGDFTRYLLVRHRGRIQTLAVFPG